MNSDFNKVASVKRDHVLFPFIILIEKIVLSWFAKISSLLNIFIFDLNGMP